MNHRTTLGALALSLALLTGPALAHHSFAMFDMKARTGLSGTVKQLDWTNPHITLWVYRDAKPGEAAELWNFESSSPGNMTRDGWTKRTLQPGDKVQIEYFPERGAIHSGELAKVIMTATGKVYDLYAAPGQSAVTPTAPR